MYGKKKPEKSREDRQGKEEATKQMHSNPETTEDHESKLKKTRIISNTFANFIKTGHMNKTLRLPSENVDNRRLDLTD